MQEERDLLPEDRDERAGSDSANEPAETAEHPVPGIKHEHEPDAENIMPVQDRPGTF